ncbi:putative two-component response regulator [Nocardia brasiliensis NBRC 14402]|uniref:response regulator n=1 Tax=Nocardia brasiliensis TaxID=37326 RepID=UPI0003143556|nr:response regulator transcription factor [Nocardia brasiliensis]ASF12065.1 DNA-binding response regulator [Nocardia brasiliensis]GAJ80130.1 putative two-component response regulator [Nocardia brasiliensis NBRC 14402]SUB09047.1 Response regulator protein vraR [Nocardia brasiliensis]
MNTQIRVLIADDHSVFRSGLRAVVDSQDHLDCVAEVSDGRTAIAETARLRPDVAILDVRMPKLDGLAATEAIVAAGGTCVLVLTTYDSDANLYRALQAGASGFLLKSLPPEELLAAIRIAARGDALIDPSMTKRLVARFAHSIAPPQTPPEVAQLTARELEVLLLLADARSNAEIASTLGVGDETVKTHVSRVLAKLGVRDRIHAVVYAHQHGLVPRHPR